MSTLSAAAAEVLEPTALPEAPASDGEAGSAPIAVPGPPPRPFIKWAGGKRRLVPTLLEQAPEGFGNYHEPFVGGGALFFALAGEPRALGPWAHLSDRNARLVRTYQAIRDQPEAVIARLRDYAENHDEEQYYAVRALDIDAAEDDADVAAWFVYLNKTGFNGLYRVNRKGGFNVPIGRYKNPNICDDENLRACSRALQGATLRCEGFEAVLERAEPGDFVYFDPPYVPVSTTSSFTAYTRAGFGLEDQARLRDVARSLKERGVAVVLSNSDTEPVRALYRRGFDKHRVMMTRAINSRARSRGAVAELLIS